MIDENVIANPLAFKETHDRIEQKCNPRTIMEIERKMQKKTLTRADICDSLCNNLNMPRQDAVNILETLLEQIAVGLEADGQVKVSSFGTFLTLEKGKRVGRNPKTGQEVIIPPRKSLSFRASTLLKSLVNRS